MAGSSDTLRSSWPPLAICTRETNLEQFVLADHDLLDGLTLAQANGFGGVEGRHDLAAQNQGQALGGKERA
jgi:hypothetical protein